MTDNTPSGIVLVDKPEGMTSFSVTSRIRKIFGVKKAGHAGTLDPFATGLLAVAVGCSAIWKTMRRRTAPSWSWEK